MFKCFVTWSGNASLKNHRLSNKNPNASHRKSPFELLVRGLQETPKTTWVIVIALGFLPELEDKILLLKTLQTLNTGRR